MPATATSLIRAAIEHRWLVLLAVFGMAAIGVFNYQKLPIDAVPDITNVQVQIRGLLVFSAISDGTQS